MKGCINKNTAEYQTLATLSGIPDFYLTAICGVFLDKYNRFPYLDEIPGADSSKYLNELLKIKKESTKVSNILEMTGTQTIQDSQIYLNNTFKDQEITLFPLNTECKVYMLKRPTTKEITEHRVTHSSNINSSIIAENIVSKLLKLYGVNINVVSNEDIQESELANIPEASNKKIFINNGELFINSSLFNLNSPVSEIVPLLISPIRNTLLYLDLLDKFDEETLFTELTNLASGKKSKLDRSNIKYDLFYNMKRTLDTILMGRSSIKDYNDVEVFSSSLKLLAYKVDSELDAENFNGTIREEELSEMYSDIKEELINNDELKIYCDV